MKKIERGVPIPSKDWFSWWKAAALLHFAATFFWDKIIFRQEGWDLPEITLNEEISFQAECLIHQIAARILAFVLIVGLWYFLHFAFTKRRICCREWVIFGCVLLSLSVLHLFHFPECFNVEWDNILTYCYAIRNIPYYWHGALTSIYYAACFYFCPLPLTVTELTIVFFSALVTFCLCRVQGLKMFAFFLLLIPEMWNLITNPYRNNLYTVLLLWATAWVLYLLQNNKKSSLQGRVLYIFILSVLAMWRTEGILFSLGLLIIFFSLETKFDIKRVLLWVGIWGAFVVILGLPQKPGVSKYYGKDYTLITTLDWLQPILSDSQVNIFYPGAEEDLEVISSATPLDWIKESGIFGYRAYNFSQGRSMNQSGMDEEDSKDYFKACFRLVVHNLSPFFRDRVNLFCQANKFDFQFPMDEYSDLPCTYPEGVSDQYYASREKGLKEMYTETNALLTAWYESPFRSLVREKLDEAGGKWLKVTEKLNLRHFAYIFAVAYPFYWVIDQMRILFRGEKRLRKNWQTALLLLVGIGEILLVTLGAPEPREGYYYPVYLFCTMLALHTLECTFIEQYKRRKLTHG